MSQPNRIWLLAPLHLYAILLPFTAVVFYKGKMAPCSELTAALCNQESTHCAVSCTASLAHSNQYQLFAVLPTLCSQLSYLSMYWEAENQFFFSCARALMGGGQENSEPNARLLAYYTLLTPPPALSSSGKTCKWRLWKSYCGFLQLFRYKG